MLTLTMMQTMWPRGVRQPQLPELELLEGIAKAAPTVLPKYGFTDRLLLAHAMSQFSHECGNGCTMTESTRYSPQRASEVWPKRFSSATDCVAKVGCPGDDPRFGNMLLDLVYGKRNGNVAGSHDGSTYIGRGLAQVTGRGNYQKLGDKLGLDLVANPALVNAPEHALECGVAMFVLRGCVAPARADDVVEVTKALNGGDVGLEDRTARLAVWKKALLQDALNRLGAEPDLATDGAFGKKSIDAMTAYQRRHNLPPNGLPDDRQTLAQIDRDLAAL